MKIEDKAPLSVHAILVAFEMYESSGGGFVQRDFMKAVKEAIPILRNSEEYKAEVAKIDRRARESLERYAE